MNFTPELSAFQGTILSADNEHQFALLTARGGNEDKIDLVIERLKTFLEQSQYIIEGKIPSSNVSQMRIFALYIVLNADLPELQQLIELEEINTLIWTTPTIPQCLLSELMWNLHMENFIYDIISYSNPQLALEVTGAFLDNFKYFDPLDCLEQLKLLSSACYILLCRLHLFNFEQNELIQKATTAFNNFQRCLKYYTTPPNNHKLNALKTAQLYKYQGRSLYSLLQSIDECLTKYTTKLDQNPPGFAIYKLTYSENSLKADPPIFNICESSNETLLEYLNNANSAMFDTCKVLVMDVSVDVFCCWSEFEENNKSMQQTVGELCYKVHNRLLNLITLSEHPLVSMIEQIARKPIEMKDIINATDDNIIVENIKNNNEESMAWIKALVYKEKLCQNSELLNIVESNLNVYNEDDSYNIYSIFKEYLKSDSENKDYVEMLSLKVFQKCELSKKMAILEERFNNKVFIDMKKTPEFKQEMTSIFNKLIATPDADLTDVLTVFLHSPYRVLYKIFTIAAESLYQAEIMLKIMKLLETFSNHYYSTETEQCMIQITQKTFDVLDTEAKENIFIKFVCGLKNASIINSTKLLLLVIMTNIHKALLSKNVRKLYVQLKLLREAFKLEELMEYRAPMLAMLAQILDVVRWKINTFCSLAPATLTLAIEQQTAVLESYNGIIPDNQSQWLKSKVSNLKPLNMYYYRILWDPPGSSYMEIVSGMNISDDMSMDELTSWLSQVICSCTQQEWCEIWDSLRVFENSMILNIIHAAVVMITMAEKCNRTENSWACMLYCYRNVMFITRYKFLAQPPSEVHVQSILSKAAMIAELLEEEDVEDFGTVLMPLFAYLTENQASYNVNFVECLHENSDTQGFRL